VDGTRTRDPRRDRADIHLSVRSSTRFHIAAARERQFMAGRRRRGEGSEWRLNNLEPAFEPNPKLWAAKLRPAKCLDVRRRAASSLILIDPAGTAGSRAPRASRHVRYSSEPKPRSPLAWDGQPAPRTRHSGWRPHTVAPEHGRPRCHGARRHPPSTWFTCSWTWRRASWRSCPAASRSS